MTTNDQNPRRPHDGARPDTDPAATTHPGGTPHDGASQSETLPHGAPPYGAPAYGAPAYGTHVPSGSGDQAPTGNAQPPQSAPGSTATPGQSTEAFSAPYPQQGQSPGGSAWPTPPARKPRNRRKTLTIAGITVGALILLGGAFGGGVAVGTAIDQPGPGQFSERMMPDGGPGGDGEMPQLPDGGFPGDDGSSDDSGSTDGSSS